MSLFRKPKKIQRRVFCADDDEEEEPEAPPPPVISREKKPVKSTPLLSFVDEEEDGEIFKVKKSSQSKRLLKKREKEKRKADTGDNKHDSNGNEETINNTHQVEKPKSKKKITLEGLILSGREALAADGTGDVSDGSANGEGEEEDDDRGFHHYRPESVRAALAVAPGVIPDAALIHAARKTRQKARELGGDYIPVRTESSGGSRLVREDGSGDEDEEGRIIVRGLELPSDKPKRGTEEAPQDEELGSEVDEWEEQQMQKAMPAITDITDACAELNPFSVAPPPPQMEAGAPLHENINVHTAEDLMMALTTRLRGLQSEREATAAQRESLEARLLAAAHSARERADRRARLDAAYRRAQALRGYLTDLIECLDEKMPQLEALEARALALHRRRCALLTERRRADVRDQAQDVMSLAARPGSVKPADNEEKVRRTAEREGRRRARRLQREAQGGAGALLHRDGDSSDDELPPAHHTHFAQEREAISRLSASLFSDTSAAWGSLRGVTRRLSRWRRKEPALYADGYLPEALPQLLAPYVRHELILWNPLADEDNEDYEKMDWYKCLMMYGVKTERGGSDSEGSGSSSEEEPFSQQTVREDLDLMLVPTLLSKVVLPKVTELVEHAWDPMCVRACVRLRLVVCASAAQPSAAAALRRLAAAAATRLHAALAADVFLPALPHNLLEGAGGVFWRRCVGAGVRLLRAALALTGPPPVLRADPIVMQLINTLCVGAGAAPGTLCASAARALADTLPRSGTLRAAALRRLALLARRALESLQSDNPLHLKAIEQARSIIAEAKATE